MRTIILSDVNSNSDSIIPYGLRLARSMETEVDVLHIIDKRVHQGTYSPVSDSQSITPGNTFSQDEIYKREKYKAEINLDKILSSEASRLNYPLKVNRQVQINSIEDELQKQADKFPESIFVFSSEADDSIFHSMDEILAVIKSTGISAILVPPGNKFKEIKKILMPIYFDSDYIKVLNEINFFMDYFDSTINAIDVANREDTLSLEMKAKTWGNVAKNYFSDETILKTNVLNGEDYEQTIISYAEKNLHDLVLILQKKENSITSFFKKDNSENLLKTINTPVFVHYYK